MNKPPILFVSNAATWPLTDGKRQRTHFLMEALSEVYTIDWLFIGYEKERELILQHDHRFRNFYFIELTNTFLVQPGYKGLFLTPRLKKIKQEFQTACNVFFESVDIHQYQFMFSRTMYPLVNLPIPKGMKIACDIDDVYFEVRKTRILNEKKIWLKLKFALLYLNGYQSVKRLFRNIQATLVIKPADKRYPGLEQSGLLPNLPFGYFMEEAGQSISNPPQHIPLHFGFIGKMSYKPNHAGMYKFIKEVWNPLQEKGFNAVLVIAGSGKIPAYLLETIKASKNIKLLGFVEHVRDFWNHIDILLSPVNEGGGTHIKIAEALMYGKRSIAHPFSTRGYDAFVEKKYILVAEQKEEWMALCESLTREKNVPTEAIIKMANEMYSVSAWKKSFIDFLQSRFSNNEEVRTTATIE